jgi:hypothetical protein
VPLQIFEIHIETIACGGDLCSRQCLDIWPELRQVAQINYICHCISPLYHYADY